MPKRADIFRRILSIRCCRWIKLWSLKFDLGITRARRATIKGLMIIRITLIWVGWAKPIGQLDRTWISKMITVIHPKSNTSTNMKAKKDRCLPSATRTRRTFRAQVDLTEVTAHTQWKRRPTNEPINSTVTKRKPASKSWKIDIISLWDRVWREKLRRSSWKCRE